MKAIAGFSELNAAAWPVPAWVSELLGDCPVETLASQTPDETVRAKDSGAFMHVGLGIRDAVSLSELELRKRVTRAYGRLAGILEDRKARHPVRFWNFIPHIQAELGTELNRYMAFNAGRYAAYLEWYGSEQAFEQHAATATGIGHDGRDLVIHVLAADQPGLHVYNPRQRRPDSYSRGHGPRPPCFARATLLRSAPSSAAPILVAGTASICGQESMHPGNLGAQVDETLANLTHLLQTCTAIEREEQPAKLLAMSAAIRCFRSLRVYYLHEHDRPELTELLHALFPHLDGIEYLHADVCRPELLVEIEGTADFPDIPSALM